MHYLLLLIGFGLLAWQFYKVFVLGEYTLSYRRRGWFTYSYGKIDLEDLFSRTTAKVIMIVIGLLQFGMFVFLWSMIENSN